MRLSLELVTGVWQKKNTLKKVMPKPLSLKIVFKFQTNQLCHLLLINYGVQFIPFIVVISGWFCFFQCHIPLSLESSFLDFLIL